MTSTLCWAKTPSASLRLLALCCSLLLTSCGPAEPDTPTPLPETHRPAETPRSPSLPVRERIERVFEGAQILKPASGDDLAPLLLVEHVHKPTAPSSSPSQPESEEDPSAEPKQAIEFARPGPKGLQAGGPRVFQGRSQVSWGEATLEQLTFYWWQRRLGSSDPWIAQGVRMTLGPAGDPIVWEVLEDSSGQRVIYVSQKVETAAKNEHGPPLATKLYSVEKASGKNVVVARILADGPFPMGPWVYLNQSHLDVTTLLCRCMASQVSSPLTQGTYDIVEAPPPTKGLETPFSDDPERAAPDWLAKVLRLPATAP